MKTSSPLRYPGGKSAMAGLLAQLRKMNGLGYKAVAEPFAGGAGASLNLLFLEETPEIFINDADPSIHDFWWSILHKSTQFSEMILTRPINMSEWRHQRQIYRSKAIRSRLQRGFAAFYLNRCNRSGIIMNGGPIGGIEQTGEWKLGARYNKRDLIKRCAKIFEFKARIHVSSQDGIEFIKRSDQTQLFYFIDPPYFNKGKTLYLNSLAVDYHAALANQLKSMQGQSWVLTYDDCPEIRRMYRGWTTIRPFSLRYVAAKRSSGRELLITPKHISLPSSQPSLAIDW